MTFCLVAPGATTKTSILYASAVGLTVVGTSVGGCVVGCGVTTTTRFPSSAAGTSTTFVVGLSVGFSVGGRVGLRKNEKEDKIEYV